MPPSPCPNLDSLSPDGLKRLVAQLLARMAALEEEDRQLRDENARLRDLSKRPKLAPGGMDRATGPDRRVALRTRFDRVFGRVTGFAELDEVVARLRTNKAELLLVLDRPEIPLHTNGSESAIRRVVTKMP